MRMRGKLPIFGYKDTFNLDATLAPIICEGLKKFKSTITGTDFGGYPITFETEEDWHEVIDKMIWSFENVKIPLDISEDYWEGTEGMGLSEKLNRNKTPAQEAIWKEYLEDCNTHQKRIEEGLALFSKYFQNLWW